MWLSNNFHLFSASDGQVAWYCDISLFCSSVPMATFVEARTNDYSAEVLEILERRKPNGIHVRNICICIP